MAASLHPLSVSPVGPPVLCIPVDSLWLQDGSHSSTHCIIAPQGENLPLGWLSFVIWMYFSLG